MLAINHVLNPSIMKKAQLFSLLLLIPLMSLAQGSEQDTLKRYKLLLTASTTKVDSMEILQKCYTLTNSLPEWAVKVQDNREFLYLVCNLLGQNTKADEEAKKYFQQAEIYYPDRLAPKEALAKCDYNICMKVGKDALRKNDFKVAKQKFEEASKIYPLSIEPANWKDSTRIKEGKYEYYLATRAELLTYYEGEKQSAINQKKEVLSQAAYALDTICEACFMEYYTYYDATEHFFEKKITMAEMEAHDQAFMGTRPDKEIHTSSPSCTRCFNVDTLNSETLPFYIKTARHKLNVYNASTNQKIDANVFRKFGMLQLEKALAKDSVNVEALLLAVEYQDELLDKMVFLKRAKDAAPKEEKIASTFNNYYPQFEKAFFEQIMEENMDFIMKNFRYHIIPDEIFKAKDPINYAIENERVGVIGILSSYLGKEKELDTYLLAAAKQNKHKSCATLLRLGANCGAKDENGKSALILATENHAEKTAEILNDCSDPESRYKRLAQAIEEQNVAGATSLLQKGISPEWKGINGDNLLMKAMKQKNGVLVDLLIKNGANTNYINEQNESPLIYAYLYNQESLINEMLTRKVAVDKALSSLSQKHPEFVKDLCLRAVAFAIDNKGNDTLAIIAQRYFPKLAFEKRDGSDKKLIVDALEKDQEGVAKALLDSDVNFNADLGDNNIFIIAVKHNAVSFVKKMFLLGKAAVIPVAPTDNDHATPLHIAATNGYKELAEALILKGHDKDLKDRKGNTPLHLAVDTEHTQIANWLIGQGAKTDILNNDGYTPLHIAVLRGSDETVKKLIEKKVAVNQTTASGASPLQLAARTKRASSKAIASYLIDNKAKMNWTDKDNQTPLMDAVVNHNTAVFDLLMEKKADINSSNLVKNTALHFAVEQNEVEMMKKLIDKKADINRVNEKEECALFIAVQKGQKDNVEYLINRKAKVNIPTKEGIYPIHVAIDNQSIDIVKMLLLAKADVNVENKEKKVPLHLALLKNNTEIAKILIEHKKIKVNAQDLDENTPLHYAVMKDNRVIATQLLDKKANRNVKNKQKLKPYEIAKQNGADEGWINFLKKASK